MQAILLVAHGWWMDGYSGFVFCEDIFPHSEFKFLPFLGLLTHLPLSPHANHFWIYYINCAMSQNPNSGIKNKRKCIKQVNHKIWLFRAVRYEHWRPRTEHQTNCQAFLSTPQLDWAENPLDLPRRVADGLAWTPGWPSITARQQAAPCIQVREKKF